MRGIFFVGSILLAASASAAEVGDWTMAVKLHGALVEGKPLTWDKQSVTLLSRDGRLYNFTTDEAKDVRRASNSFQGYSAAEMRERLNRELGQGYDVTHTGRYLVASPKGSKQNWAPRFEEMYREFVHYFTIRGLAPREPEFPLLAIVLPSQEAFERYSAADGSPFGRGYLGYYSAKTNRVVLYDQQTSGADWAANADTIVHEVTHQTAYNTGVHRRFASTPRWLVEGLGTVFEARGVWNARNYTRQQDRYNLGRLAEFRQKLPNRKAGLSAELIASDRLFDVDVSTAYAESWALSFYLAEKMPKKYCDYLTLTARRPTFTNYTSAERVRDFTSVFGTDLKLLEAQFLRFMNELQ